MLDRPEHFLGDDPPEEDAISAIAEDPSMGRMTNPRFQRLPQAPSERQPNDAQRYLPRPEQVAEHWRTIQSGFAADPERSLATAHQLVGHVLESVFERLGRQRLALEQKRRSGETISREELSQCLQPYVAFFARILPNDTPTR